jgi:SAM-dependent methyltransferase
MSALEATADDLPLVGDFFVLKDYDERAYPLYGDIVQKLRASAAAATDFDLTGQIVWLVAHLTSYYLSAPHVREELKGKDVLELGCGAGIAGLTASKWCKQAVLSDNEPEVIKLMEQNLEYGGEGCITRAVDLSWGDREGEARLAAISGVQRWPIIVGADVVYWSHAVPLLFDSVKQLLADDGVFILGYFNRVSSNKTKVEELATAAGLTWTTVDPDTFLEPDTDVDATAEGGAKKYKCPQAFLDHMPKMTIYRFTWANKGAASN